MVEIYIYHLPCLLVILASNNMEPIKLKRARSPREVESMKFNPMGFEGDWLHHLGDAVKEGSWFIYGPSGNGKTHYALKLAKYLTSFGRVAYDSIEQGESATMQAAFAHVGMVDVNKRIVLLDKESLEELRYRLNKQKSPDIIIIDSLQTLRFDRYGERGINYTDYRRLMADFPGKLFIFISKCKGSQPWNDLATNIKFDSHIKIWVESFFANVETTRYAGGGEMYDIWPNR